MGTKIIEYRVAKTKEKLFLNKRHSSFHHSLVDGKRLARKDVRDDFSSLTVGSCGLVG
jgi:hypothetical protein